jgi:hypothetical protein
LPTTISKERALVTATLNLCKETITLQYRPQAILMVAYHMGENENGWSKEQGFRCKF